MHHVYSLRDPETGELRYIGVSSDPSKRLIGHLSHPSPEVGKWLKELAFPPLLEIEFSCASRQECERVEAEYIERLSVSCRLLNYAHSNRHGYEFTGIGKRISERCKSIGISATALCREAWLNQSVLSDLIRSKRHDIAGSSLVKLARFLGVSAEYLMTGES